MSSIVWQALSNILLLLTLVSFDSIQHHVDHVYSRHKQGCLTVVVKYSHVCVHDDILQVL